MRGPSRARGAASRRGGSWRRPPGVVARVLRCVSCHIALSIRMAGAAPSWRILRRSVVVAISSGRPGGGAGWRVWAWRLTPEVLVAVDRRSGIAIALLRAGLRVHLRPACLPGGAVVDGRTLVVVRCRGDLLIVLQHDPHPRGSSATAVIVPLALRQARSLVGRIRALVPTRHAQRSASAAENFSPRRDASG